MTPLQANPESSGVASTVGVPDRPLAVSSVTRPTLDIVQSVFFVVVGVVTVLTYKSAKKTILQPVKTEIFKKQLDQLTEMLGLFTGKSEMEVRELFGFPELIKANTFLLLDMYASEFFDIEADASKRPYSTAHCSITRMNQSHFEKYVVLPEAQSPELHKPAAEARRPAIVAAQWSQFEFGGVSIPNKMTGMLNRTDRLIQSPLLPKDLIAILEELQSACEKNIGLIESVFTAVARELPTKYPTLDSLKRADLGWIHNQYNNKFHQLKPIADRIGAYARGYLSTESLLHP